MIETNQAFISGRLVSGFRAVTTARGKRYYVADLLVRRLSSVKDCIPVKVPGWLIDERQDYKGQYVKIVGQYQTCNYYDGLKRRLKQYIYARELEVEDFNSRCVDDNYIFLDGYVCREPVYRITPLGQSVTDLLIAVDSPCGEAYYIPCICWGKTAHSAAGLSVGERIEIRGRMQSREYDKKLDDFTVEKRIAYEVSVMGLEYIRDQCH